MLNRRACRICVAARLFPVGSVESLAMRYLPYVAFVILLASASLALRYLQKTR